MTDTFTHRRASALTTGVQKPAGAVASVFEAGHMAKSPRRQRVAPIDPSSIVIESGIPVPPIHTGGSPYLAIAKRMGVGDSVVLSTTASKSMYKVARQAGYGVVMRSIAEGKMRVWINQLPDKARPAGAAARQDTGRSTK